MYAIIETGGKQYKVAVGDKVKVEISPYDLSRGRITWRKKG